MKCIEVAPNGAGWLDRPLVNGPYVYLCNADLSGAGGEFPYLEVRRGLDGSLVKQRTVCVEAGREVFPSRPQLGLDGTVLVAVYIQNQDLELQRLDPEGELLQSWRWTGDDYDDLAAMDMACKLFPGCVADLGESALVSWIYRQGRSYQTLTTEGPLSREWTLACTPGAILSASEGHVQSRTREGKLIWQLPAMTYLGASADNTDRFWFLDERKRKQSELERAETYLNYLEVEQIEQADLPESQWNLQHPLEDEACVVAIGSQEAHPLAEIPFSGELRSFASLEGGGRVLVHSLPEERHRIQVKLGDLDWQRDFPGCGCAFLGLKEGLTWWCDSRYWHCRDGQGKSLRSGAWPAGFSALGFGPRICDRGPLWSNAVLGPQGLLARSGEQLLLPE